MAASRIVIIITVNPAYCFHCRSYDDSQPNLGRRHGADTMTNNEGDGCQRHDRAQKAKP